MAAPEQVALEQGTLKDGFVPAPATSQWYEHLQRYGSCLRLYDMLVENRALIHELGPEDITVLHKGVQHGCVKLVRFILVEMFDGDGKCTCRQLNGEDNPCVLTREGLLRKTCEYGSTAVNMAVVSGSPKMVLLLKWAIDESVRCKNRGLVQRNSTLADTDYFFRWKFTRMQEKFRREKGRSGEKEGTEISNDAGVHLEVPDVTDDGVGGNIYGMDVSNMIMEVYKLIEEKLNENWGDDQELMDMLKDMCKEDVDFGFVPVGHVFLHFLLCIYHHGHDRFVLFQKKILEKILVACAERDCEAHSNGVSMLVTLFSILDPRGRPILHIVGCGKHNLGGNMGMICEIVREIEGKLTLPSIRIRECVNAKNGAGRTLLHQACILDHDYIYYYSLVIENVDWKVTISPLCCDELYALKLWCFPQCQGLRYKNSKLMPIHLAVLFNAISVLDRMLTSEDVGTYINASHECIMLYSFEVYQPFQIAALLGRVTIVNMFLKNNIKSKLIKDKGLGSDTIDDFPTLGSDIEDDLLAIHCDLPAIHCAAVTGQVEVIQTILQYSEYDPICQHPVLGTALHLLLIMKECPKVHLELLNVLTLFHVLPNDDQYTQVKHDFCKLDFVKTMPRALSDDEVSCINLLLQAGIDLWTPSDGNDNYGQIPNVGPNANNETRKWWYDKVVKEVVTQKASITSASNATSVIGALVATTSFIGPLQPPLGYDSSYDGYIATNRSPIRVYLVCNNLSFYFSIASILMALLPAIPMPKESMYEELLRSQRCLKGAALMLLIAITCILISFSSASIVVVSSDWHDKLLVASCIVVGGVICALVLVIYIIRLLRMLFHKNNRFRRWFANHMYF